MEKPYSFGYWVRRRRKSLDLTQAALASKVFCTLSMIKKIELDIRRPSPLMAERLAECLHIDGKDREAFLKAAAANLAVDRLPILGEPVATNRAVSNLVQYLPDTPFIGYEKELAFVTRALGERQARLVTLVGSSGMGKTRIALQAATSLERTFPDGIFFFPLGTASERIHLIYAILDSLAQKRSGIKDLKAYLINSLQDRSILLVMDDFEDIPGGATLLAEILHAASQVSMLVTSHKPLRLQSEQVVNIHGLSTLTNGDTEEETNSSAVQLFIQTARRRFLDFTPTEADTASILNICRMVGGMPLAIILAASWIPTRNSQEIEGDIQHSLDFLTSDLVDIPERHRSIQAAFDFSWQLLTSAEQRIFAALSVFQGGFNLQAASAIVGADLPGLAFLVGKSLLNSSRSGRYSLHALLRRLVAEKLAASGLEQELLQAHLAYYLDLAVRASTGGNGVLQAHIFEMDQDNFRLALSNAIRTGRVEIGLRLANAMADFWHEEGYLREGVSWLQQVLDIPVDAPLPVRVEALNHMAELLCSMGEYQQSSQLSKESLSIALKLRDQRSIALGLLNLGTVRFLTGEYERAAWLLEKCSRMLAESGEQKHYIHSLLRLADLRMRQGKLEESGSLWTLALSCAQAIGDSQCIAWSLGGLGDLNRNQGNYRQAIRHLQDALLIHWQQNQLVDIAYVLEALAMSHVPAGSYALSAHLWGAAQGLRERTAAPLPPAYQVQYTPFIAQASAGLGEASHTQAWQDGRSKPLDLMIRMALE